ncbi:LOW QUALITY PROTEIN: hypothetical protein MXB_4525, partial [Myxobolus squamalis]
FARRLTTLVMAAILQKNSTEIIEADFQEPSLKTTEIPAVLFNHANQGIMTAIHGKIITKNSIRKMNIIKENCSAPLTPADRVSIIPGLATIIRF